MVLAAQQATLDVLNHALAPHVAEVFGTVDPDELVAMIEAAGPESVGQVLFERQGMPTKLRATHFNPNGLQRAIPGQSGQQIFFTEADRAFCVYVVLGSHDNGRALVPLANEVLANIVIEPRA